VKLVGELGVAVLGAVVTYVAVTLTEHSAALLRWSIVGVLGVVSLAAACLAARSGAAVYRRRRVAVADRIDTEGGVEARDIHVSPTAAEDVRVATNIRAKGDVRVENVRVQDKQSPDSGDRDA
jgi:hypothetical protein